MHMLWLLGFIGLVGSNPSRVGKKSGHPRGEFVPAEDTLSPNLMQGDIAVPESRVGGEDDALDAFVTDKKALWMTGIVRYRIEEDEYEGVVEPVFTDDQIANITKALEQIETEVPCIEFRYNNSPSSSLGQNQLFSDWLDQTTCIHTLSFHRLETSTTLLTLATPLWGDRRPMARSSTWEVQSALRLG